MCPDAARFRSNTCVLQGIATKSGRKIAANHRRFHGAVLPCCSYKIAAEQKARTTYDNILRFCDDYDVRDPIRFLREREIVHYQRFGEALRIATDQLDSTNFYAFNPEFDRKKKPKR